MKPSRRLAQALGLASCPLSYALTTALFGPGSGAPWGALLALSSAWALLELTLGIARPATRRVANAPWVKLTRGLWLLGPWVSWLDARHGWTRIAVPVPLQQVLLGAGLVGLLLRLTAVLSLGSAFTYDHSVGPGGSLVTTGVYRVIRHPAYAGLLVLTNLIGVLLGSVAGVLLLATTVPNVLQRIQAEEADLARVYGDAYERYARRSSRLIPFVF